MGNLLKYEIITIYKRENYFQLLVHNIIFHIRTHYDLQLQEIIYILIHNIFNIIFKIEHNNIFLYIQDENYENNLR